MSTCPVCLEPYDAGLVELPAITCSPECLAVVDAELSAALADGEPGRIERRVFAAVSARRYPPERPAHWMARAALAMARQADRRPDPTQDPDRWFRVVVAHALDAPGSPRSQLDRIRGSMCVGLALHPRDERRRG